MPVWDQLVAGFGAGAVTTLCLHPLDLVKTRMQLQYHAKTTTWSELVSIHRQRGLRGLYQGFSANLAGGTASWGFYFMWYALMKQQLNASTNGRLSPADHLMAAAGAGFITVLMTNPLWLCKTRLCIQDPSAPNAYRGLWNALTTIYRQEGIPGLYKGLVPATFGVSHGAIQFMIYEEMKRQWSQYTRVETEARNNTLEYIVMAAGSKSIATAITYPYQVVRSRLQDHRGLAEFKGASDVLFKTLRSDGWRGMYRGLAPNLIRVLPGTCLTFGAYESITHFLTHVVVSNRYGGNEPED